MFCFTKHCARHFAPRIAELKNRKFAVTKCVTSVQRNYTKCYPFDVTNDNLIANMTGSNDSPKLNFIQRKQTILNTLTESSLFYDLCIFPEFYSA